jgi:hypothetical protein
VKDTGAETVLVVEDDGPEVQRVMLELINNGAPQFLYQNTAPGGADWRLGSNAQGTFVINEIADLGIAELAIFPNGNVGLPDGKLGIGTAAPGLRLHVQDTATSNEILRLQNASQTCDYKPDLTPSCISDARLKTDISPLDTARILADLGRIDLFEYRFAATGEDAIGPVAQRLRGTHPDRVSEGEDGMLRATLPSQVELLAAVQELTKLVASLENTVRRLETQSSKPSH